MECKSCSFWKDKKCTDLSKWVDTEGTDMCRYNPKATILLSPALDPVDVMREDLRAMSQENEKDLMARLERAIFKATKPSNLTMKNFDSGAILGRDNYHRKQVELAAELVLAEFCR